MSEVKRYHPKARCEECSLFAEHSYVPTYKPPQPALAVCGEGPGAVEVRSGRPFSGPSGKLLALVLAEHGIDIDNVILTNAVSCRPPENRDPSKLELACCEPRLKDDLANVNKVLAVGKPASNAVMGTKSAITSLRIGPPRPSSRYPHLTVVPTFHPASCLRSSDNFPSFVKDIAKINGVRIKWEPPTYEVIERSEDVSKLGATIRSLPGGRRVVFDIETAYDKDTGFAHASNIPLLCIGVGSAPGRVNVLGREVLRSNYGRLFEGTGLTAHNGKFDLQGIRRDAPNSRLSYDTMLASYADDERGGVHGLKYLATEILGAPDYAAEMKKYKNYSDAPLEVLHKYNAYDVALTWALQDHYEAQLDVDGKRLTSFLVEASNALTPMEYEGIRVDTEYLEKIEGDFTAELEGIEVGLTRWVENPRSPQQVARAFAKLGLDTDTTNKEFLGAIIEGSSNVEGREFAGQLLTYRQQHKLFSTYVRGARNRLYNGRLYPTFLLHGTTTGRLSCRNPNLFNIPRGSIIRKLFVPDEGKVFVEVDIKQNESRVVCALSRDENLRAILSDPSRDMHQEVANKIGLTRQHAKTIVHAVAYEAYGKEEYLLAHHAGKPINWARTYMKEYFKLFPQVAAWKRDLARRVLQEQEDLVTPYGRHRRFFLITRENQEDIIRQATAFMPQSIGSDICLTALVRLLEMGIKCRLSVYDNIIAECDPSDAFAVGRLMEKVVYEAGREFTDYVPFYTDVKVGKSWGDLA